MNFSTRTSSRVLWTSLTCLLMVTYSPRIFAEGDTRPSGKDLIAAAQSQDHDTIRQLLEAGVDVNSANRYGATALFFAVDRGDAALVETLLERGADVNVTDTFYQADPLGWALFQLADSPEHRQIAFVLLEAGSSSAPAAFRTALRTGDLELARASWATEKITPDIARASAAGFDAEAHPELAEWLTEIAGPLDQPVEVAAEPVSAPSEEEIAAWSRHVGRFRSEVIDRELVVAIESGLLKARLDEDPAFVLEPTNDPLRFAVQGGPDLSIVFDSSDARTSSLSLHQGTQAYEFQLEGAAKTLSNDQTPSERLEAQTIQRAAARPWPSFRGPRASGIGDGQAAPAAWNPEDGTNVLWKTAIPGLGLSSPVVWGDLIVLTTAVSETGDSSLKTGLYGDVGSVDDPTEHVYTVVALELGTGEVRWTAEAARAIPAVKRHFKSSHANPTPAVDAERVVALFGTAGLFVYDHDGTLLWSKDLGRLGSGWFFDPTYEWGFASSPILHDGRIVIQADVYEGSFLAAFDAASGEELWRTPRDEIPTWGTPTVVPAGDGFEIVTNGPTIRGYDFATGKELWTLGPNSEITVGTPVAGEGMVYVTGGYPPARPIYAIRPGGRGDLSLADGVSSGGPIAWSHQPGGTYMPTPIVYRGLLYMLNNNGRLAAYDAATGEMVYRRRVGKSESFSGSPVAADGRLYITSEQGNTHVIQAGRTHRVLQSNSLGEAVMTTPAISDGILVLRGAEHVFGLGESAPD